MLSKFIVKSVMLGKGRVLVIASVSMLWTSAFIVNTERGCLQVGMPRKKREMFIYGTKRLHAHLNAQKIMFTTFLNKALMISVGYACACINVSPLA